MKYAIVDTGPLYAAVDADDDDHEACVRVLQAPHLRLIVPAMCVAEAAYLIASRMGAKVEAAFLAGLQGIQIEAPNDQDLRRMADLVEKYASFPLGGTDASVIALAERLGTDLVVSLDHRHMRAVAPRHCAGFRLLPE